MAGPVQVTSPGRRVLGRAAPWRQLPSVGATAGTAGGDAARLDVDRPAAVIGLLPISRCTAARAVSTSCSATRTNQPQAAQPPASRVRHGPRRLRRQASGGSCSPWTAWRSIPTRSVVRWCPCRPGRPGCSSSRSPRAPVPRWPGTRPVGRPTGRDRYRGRPGPGQRPGPCLFPARRRRRGGRRPGAYATGGWRCCRAVSHSRGLTSRANPCGDVREAPARRRQR